MNPERKERLLNDLDSIANHNKVISEMLNGNRPANQQDAVRLSQQISVLLERTRNLIDIS